MNLAGIVRELKAERDRLDKAIQVLAGVETGLAQTYPNLGWLIMVSQDQQEALAPVRTLGQFALLMVVLGLLMLTLLVVYFFLEQREPFEQEEMLQIRERSRGRGAA